MEVNIKVPKINKLQRIVLAVQDISLLNSFDSELSIVADTGDLLGITFAELFLGMQRLEDEQMVLEITNTDERNKLVSFFVKNAHGIDFWANEIRSSNDKIPGEIKKWQDLEISLERAWLKYKGEKIKIGLEDKSILFLLSLIDVKGALVPYRDLSKKLGLTSSLEENFESVPEDLKSFKQDLQKYLIKKKLPKEYAVEIKKMIEPVRKSGYQLV